MKDIKCQNCNGGEPCPACGGYGIVFAVARCACGNEYYTRMGAFTIYEGKTFRTMDGLIIKYGVINGGCIVTSCSKCEEGLEL